MREIKFRAWDKKERQMSEPFNLYSVGYLNDENGYDSKYYTLLQYTGLKDKNGKEIYEGDLISQPTVPDGYKASDFIIPIWQVLWHKNGWHELLLNRPDIKNYYIPIFIGEWDEVIGDIYENPELLEV